MIYCFDVFDTVLTRVFAKPEDLFLEQGRILGEHHLYSGTEEDWQQLRQESERETGKEKGDAKVTLEDIYNVIGKKRSWNCDQIQQATQVEITLEEKNIRAVPRLKKIIEDIHEERKSVIFFSDMYLPSSTIQSLLVSQGIWKDGDELYTSSEYGESKYSGKLFEIYMKRHSKKPSDITYFGNSVDGDITPAKNLGIAATFVPDSNLTRYEEDIRNRTENSLKLNSLIAGASRLSRLQNLQLSPEEQVLVNTAADTAAPTLFFFALWCIQEAKRRNIERLYFLSRDGYIVQKIAKRIANALSLSIDCRYLYASRNAWTSALHNKEIHDNTLGYLLQEGFGNGSSYAIVDIGWGGTMQDALNTILKNSTYHINTPVTGFYFALFRTITAAEKNQFIPYFSHGQGLHARDFILQDYGHRALMELFVRANHGTVRGYQYKNGIYEAEYFEQDPDIVSSRGFTVYEETIGTLCDQLLEQLDAKELATLEGREIIEKILTLLMMHPSVEEANILGAQFFSHEKDNKTYYELSPVLQEGAISNHIFWKEGSIVRSTPMSLQQQNPNKTLRLLNIGCGDRYHGDWVNIDLNPVSKEILKYDIRYKLPFSDSSFDVVYHSHVLEHMTRKDGATLVAECRRVLKPGGILRIAVPDLERLAISYITTLQTAEHGGPLETLKHEWATLELYDQVVRTKSGGEANEFIMHATDSELQAFLESRWGKVAKILLGKIPPEQPPVQANRSIQWHIREAILRFFLREEYPLLQTARYQNSGEVHKWMYDSHALGVLLSKSGFNNLLERTPFESYIPNWKSYELDSEPDGTVVKPDSLFVEGIAV